MTGPRGLALYVRAIRKSRHGTPAAFAKRCADHGLGWIALGGAWHDQKGERWINRPSTIHRYADALAARGVDPYVWAYPAADRVELFVEHAAQAMGPSVAGLLLDPELAMNPSRRKSRRAAGERAAAKLIRDLRAIVLDGRPLGSSTYGRPPRWMPIHPFLTEVDFTGGQHYTRSAAQTARDVEWWAAELAGVVAPAERVPRLVPNFGTYRWKTVNGKRRAKSKTPAELDEHLGTFIGVDARIDTLIGWAENFVTSAQWKTLARWADWIDRGVCRLDARRARD